MAAKGKGRELFKLQSTESSYYYVCTLKKGAEKLEIKKYDPNCQRHVTFKQSKHK